MIGEGDDELQKREDQLNLFGELPLELSGLPNLQVTMQLSSEVPEGFSIPSEIGSCSDIENLELGSNTIVGCILADLSRLTFLRVLDFGGNNLTGDLPKEISKCSGLTTLLVDYNHIFEGGEVGWKMEGRDEGENMRNTDSA
ncbi:hypothetical protein VIGAN_10190000 [Vigna angularis var. angularis]|uniref:Uncharacterized protein n=1 Tax=Vigna angularis var. angularis TaxID=157739 RepID=A0A0S3T5I1_PHAAN|nr:hypothetical protein VIGAN_10190000 [Vigna angularis var. angularis]